MVLVGSTPGHLTRYAAAAAAEKVSRQQNPLISILASFSVWITKSSESTAIPMVVVVAAAGGIE